MTTLEKIRKKVRRLTGTPDALQLPDSELDEYVDTFYLQDLPAHLKLFELHETYTFYTDPNEDEYALPVNTYTAVMPPVYVAGYECSYYQKRSAFFNAYPMINYDENATVGNSTAGPYSFTLTYDTIMKREVKISAIDSTGDTINLVDDGAGNLTYPEDTTVRGSVNYTTGAVAITDFGNTIPPTSDIYAQYVPYTASRPTDVLFYDNTFTLRPIPDKSYKVEINSYRTPSLLLNAATDSPQIDQWWQFIAFGAALKVLEDRGDLETLATLMPRYDEQKQLVLHRTIKQITPQRTPTIYSDTSGVYNGNNWGWF